ncbi:gluconate 2-dehydrogenase subunit 3 family protein [Paenibacillus qinlingensis]|uniref:Gluconate 2-dehydrogenase subunit 3 family protein n=1 Tax=Paenibacillus qinlingensis TaxID=1837343 RepID=A0ABU1P5L4_9BACL|nr:gluconate 2-dehydrogenase subunit 3 family protein [Paenibacillus qinlingensis]MDR6555048.1 hypothetical protein [Paenibacillus qinlingensis]
MQNHNHYPTYDVMEESKAWDAHTRSIVMGRLIREQSYGYLTFIEAENLRIWCSLLMDDHRGEIMQYIISHIDRVLADNKGEGNRKVNVPPIRTLIRQGLKAIDETGWIANSQPFFQLDESNQRSIMLQISNDSYPPTTNWEGIPQKILFQKLLQLSIEAYYAHPLVWSEIGFGGPAYPRGYTLNGPSDLESWEAVKRS